MTLRLLWWTFIGLDAVLVLSYLAGYVSAYLPPEIFWWTGLPATILPYLAGTLLVVAAAALWNRRWVLCASHILLALLILPRLPALTTSPAPSDTEEMSPTLNIMSFNVPPPTENESAMQAVRRRMHDMIASERPHVVAFQGALVANGRFPGGARASWHVDTLRASGYEFLPPNFALQPNDPNHQSVFSRIGLEEKEFLRLAADAPSERRATRAVFRWEGEPVVLYNVHLRSFDRAALYRYIREGRYMCAARNLLGMYRRSTLQRVEEAHALRALMKQEKGPVIVAGDFNSTPYNWEYRHLARGMRDVHTAAGQGWGGTWHSRLPFVRIDHVLVSPEWEVSSARVLSSDLSDHLPVVVSLRRVP